MKNSFLFCLIVMILAQNFTNAYPSGDMEDIKSYNTDNYHLHNINKRVIIPISKMVKIYRGIQEILDALQRKTRHWLKPSEAINNNAFFTRSNLRTK